MNEQIPQSGTRTTQFADGLPRRCWTVAEFEKMAAVGLFSGNGIEGERLELLGGEIVPMPPKGIRHELVRTELQHRWSGGIDRVYKILPETQFRLDANSSPVPDIMVVPASLLISELTPSNVHLIVEIADTSIVKDTEAKAQLYAAAGVRDYWVINAANLVTTVFREPTETGYRSRADVLAEETLAPLDAPELAIALDELGI